MSEKELRKVADDFLESVRDEVDSCVFLGDLARLERLVSLFRMYLDSEAIRTLRRKGFSEKLRQLAIEAGKVKAPYIAKQLPQKRKHDKDLVLRIVERLGSANTGKILIEYNALHEPPISLGHLGNILGQLESEGKLTRELVSRGRHGRTTIITSLRGG